MKYCPTCNTRYDEEILRFCMKDGTPLVEEVEPAFIEMPSESIEEPEDEPGEVTIIRNKDTPAPPPPQNLIDEISFTPDPTPSRERIVVPMADEQPQFQQPRARVIPPYQPLPQPPNTAKVVVLTIIGTIAAMAIGAFGFWMIQNDRSAENLNINTSFNNSLENVNLNVNTNLGNSNGFDFNINGNFNSPTNINANLRTPTPTPTPRPSPSATATPVPPPTPEDEATPRPTPVRPSASPTPIVIRPGGTPPRTAPTNRPPANN